MSDHRFQGRYINKDEDGGKIFLNRTNYEYLTLEQALVDFSILIEHVKKTSVGTVNSKVIVIGTMLAALMRFKYPHLVDGALSSSTPLYASEPSSC